LRFNVTEFTIYDEALVLFALRYRVSNHGYCAPIRSHLARLRRPRAQQRSAEHAEDDVGWRSGRPRLGGELRFPFTLTGVRGVEVRMYSHTQDISLFALTFCQTYRASSPLLDGKF
jgi:hypothetical protein